MSSYVKAVLIPWEQFQRLTTDKEPTITGAETSSLLPPDVQLKLMRQERLVNKHKHQPGAVISPAVSTFYPTKKDVDPIVDSIPEKWRPYGRSILLKILEHPQQISWKNDYELVFNNQTQVNTNIVELLQFILKQKVVTSEEDIPQGAREFHDTLLQIGVPKSWLKVNLNQRRSQRKRTYWRTFDGAADDST